eukprot:5638260-Pleurochrysis_carterae.AAC.3
MQLTRWQMLFGRRDLWAVAEPPDTSGGHERLHTSDQSRHARPRLKPTAAFPALSALLRRRRRRRPRRNAPRGRARLASAWSNFVRFRQYCAAPGVTKFEETVCERAELRRDKCFEIRTSGSCTARFSTRWQESLIFNSPSAYRCVGLHQLSPGNRQAGCLDLDGSSCIVSTC